MVGGVSSKFVCKRRPEHIVVLCEKVYRDVPGGNVADSHIKNSTIGHVVSTDQTDSWFVMLGVYNFGT